ncbi:MAG: hypothetical protein CMJ94_00245 [Planctomycetes bacterium]|nr:hypothetical protein [Planctomycetota bacterium]
MRAVAPPSIWYQDADAVNGYAQLEFEPGSSPGEFRAIWVGTVGEIPRALFLRAEGGYEQTLHLELHPESGLFLYISEDGLIEARGDPQFVLLEFDPATGRLFESESPKAVRHKAYRFVFTLPQGLESVPNLPDEEARADG